MESAGALKVRSPLVRRRPWVSDTTWVAHESLPLFSTMAALMGSPGWWRLGEGGASPSRPGAETPDLVAFMALMDGLAEPCVVHDEAAATLKDGEQVVDVLDPSGKAWLFSHDVIYAAALGQAGWSWRIAPHGKGAVLVGYDRKDRVRFALMCFGVDES